MRRQATEWIADVVIGGVLGGIAVVVGGVGFVIFSGVDASASIPDRFRSNPLEGVITVAVLAAGPVAGIVLARVVRGLSARRTREVVLDVVFGGFIGAVTGAIVAVNVVGVSDNLGLAGVEQGPLTSVPDVFHASVSLGVVMVVILAAGPIAGVIVARRLRRRQTPPSRDPGGGVNRV